MLYTQYLHIIHHLQAMKMTFQSYFLFARSKIQNLWKNGPIWRKIQKKLTPQRSWSLFFPSLGSRPSLSEFFALSECSLITFCTELCAEIAVKHITFEETRMYPTILET